MNFKRVRMIRVLFLYVKDKLFDHKSDKYAFYSSLTHFVPLVDRARPVSRVFLDGLDGGKRLFDFGKPVQFIYTLQP